MTKDVSRRSGLRRFASTTSLVTAFALVTVKLLAWIATGSVALLTSAVDALVDTGASFVTYFGVRYAERPPDHDHRFGHGKGEAVAAFTQATVLAGAAIALAVQSARRIIYPEPIRLLEVGLWVIIASLLAAVGLVIMQTWVVRKRGLLAAYYVARKCGILGRLSEYGQVSINE
jgi:ferrous-iron efflux pump FieF